MGVPSDPVASAARRAGPALAARARPWLAGAAYAIVFALLLRRLLAASATSFGAGNNPLDSRTIAWVQAWLARCLASEPGAIPDAPIYYPAPSQLTGADHFLSSQILFAPVFWASGNAVLAANTVVIASYPLAAFAMERLLSALGIAPLAAWVAGLVFALGPLGVPATNQLTQYLVLYLPLTALALRRVRDEPSWRRASIFGLVLLLAVFSSYYMAFLVAVAASAWTAVELLRPEPARLRFLARLVPPVAAAAALLILFSQPYLAQRDVALDLSARRAAARALETEPSPPTAAPTPGPTDEARPVDHWSGARLVLSAWPARGDWSLLFAALGVAALASSSRPARRSAAAGVVFVVLGSALLVLIVEGFLGPLPPILRFFRNPFRLFVLTGFGIALLSAAVLEGARATIGPRLGAAAALAAAAAVLSARGPNLVAPELDRVDALATHREAYRAVRRIADAEGGGALLELPWVRDAKHNFVPDAMLASAIHGLPLLTGFGATTPPHWPLVARALARLPNAAALRELVDLTHVRWILLRPVPDWANAAQRAAFERWLAAAARGPAFAVDSFHLQRVDLEPRHPEWLAALRRGYRPGESLLGTPYDPLPPGAAVAKLTAPRKARAVAGRALRLPLELANRGSATWPGALTRNGGSAGEVYIAARWLSPTGNGHGAALPTGRAFGLARDVPPGETLRDVLVLPAPALPGEYELDLRLAQRGSDAFASVPEPAARVRVVVVGAPYG